jgi:flagellar protein FliS
MKSAVAYASNAAETGVASAEAGQLIVLVYERVFDHLRIAKKALEEGEYGVEPFTKAHDLIQQGLLACLNFKDGGDVAQNLGAIYEWSLREILSARLTKSPQKVQSVIDTLAPLHEAWINLAPKESMPKLQAVSQNKQVRPAAAY